MVQIKVLEEIKTHILCSITFFFYFENRSFYEIMWKNAVERGRPQMTIWRMRIACWIPKVTNTHWEFVTPIAFSLQQCLKKRVSLSVLLNYVFIIICCNITVSLNCELCLSFPISTIWAAIMIPQIKLRIENRKESEKTENLNGICNYSRWTF